MAVPEDLRFSVENRERIQAVENSFGPSGRGLLVPGRVLVGEGRLMKLSRRRPQPKAFFLFNDILVYGSVVVAGRWNKGQQVVRLEEVLLEDLEDGEDMRNQWLLKTPRKSFQVAAASAEEKRMWMEHIERCREEQLRRLGVTPARDFAAAWVPDQASDICMRCSERFTVAHRRHHCRRCGFIVCKNCSKARAVLHHISRKPVRICTLCKHALEGQERLQNPKPGLRAKRQASSDWKTSSTEEKPKYETSSDEEGGPDQNRVPTQWFGEDFSPYCYFNPQHARPPLL
ncbi:pleckstrin homology domain-containing family F member 1 [Hoplias malabaricus]|uniref:pleckstrin homology domain-containing family F member 2-like n=1 Tax=Hoplias malabaricus TaxID=27720 RepID=UPI003461A2F2